MRNYNINKFKFIFLRLYYIKNFFSKIFLIKVLKNNNSPLTIKDLSSAINTSYQFKEKDDLKPLDGLLILIKLMDKVYFNLLDLTNKIKLNNKQSLLQNFPKIEEDIEEIEEEITDVEDDDMWREVL